MIATARGAELASQPAAESSPDPLARSTTSQVEDSLLELERERGRLVEAFGTGV
jgi:hypothetical protein